MVTGLPAMEDPNREIREYFERSGSEVGARVTAINLVYLMDEVDALMRQHRSLIAEKQRALAGLQFDSDTFHLTAFDFDQRISALKHAIKAQSERIHGDYGKFSGTAFVSFERE